MVFFLIVFHFFSLFICHILHILLEHLRNLIETFIIIHFFSLFIYWIFTFRTLEKFDLNIPSLSADSTLDYKISRCLNSNSILSSYMSEQSTALMSYSAISAIQQSVDTELLTAQLIDDIQVENESNTYISHLFHTYNFWNIKSIFLSDINIFSKTNHVFLFPSEKIVDDHFLFFSTLFNFIHFCNILFPFASFYSILFFRMQCAQWHR